MMMVGSCPEIWGGEGKKRVKRSFFFRWKIGVTSLRWWGTNTAQQSIGGNPRQFIN
jgi:hypothetical protein